MSDINWKDGAVCYANGEQRFSHDGSYFMRSRLISTPNVNTDTTAAHLDWLLEHNDFQLNEIREGDFIPASELDTEQKYNEVVDVFGLFGFPRYENCQFHEERSTYIFADGDGDFTGTNELADCKGRQLTYSQIIAIGKLKRMMLEREKSAPKIAPDKQKSAVDYLNECVEVQKQRGEQYDSTGTGERSFDAAAKAYNALTGGNLKGSDVCLLLTCVKAVRQYSSPNRLHEDSLLDLVSYASLWAEELNKELK